MATLAQGQAARLNLKASQSITVTPSSTGRATVSANGPSNLTYEQKTIYAAETFGPYVADTVMNIAAVAGSLEYTDPYTLVPSYATDSSGNVTGLVGLGGRMTGWSRSLSGAGYGVGVDPFGQVITASNVTAITGETTSAVTATEVQTAEGQGLRVVSDTVSKYIQIDLEFANPMLIAELGVLLIANGLTQNTVQVFVGVSSAFSGTLNDTASVSGGSGANRAYSNGLPTWILFGTDPTMSWANSTPYTLSTQLFTHVRVRVAPIAGQLANFTLIRCVANPKGKSRLTITADDGYISQYTYLASMLQKRGLVCSLGIIPARVGSSADYMTLRQLQELKANGHEIITHGPIPVGGSLISNYANAELAVQDMITCRQQLVDWGLITTDAEYASYIWPQGVFQFSAGDTSLIDAAIGAGFTLARSTTRYLPISQRLHAGTIYGRFINGIVGHTRSTVSEVAEDAEVAATIDAIEYAGANGMDGTLMLHSVIADQGVWAATSGNDIEVSRLASILDAIVVEIAAGRAVNALYSNFSGK